MTPEVWTEKQRRGYGLVLRLRTAFERGLRRRVQSILQSQAPGVAEAARRGDPLGAIGVRLQADIDRMAADFRASYVASGTASGELRTDQLGARRFLPEAVVRFARENALVRSQLVTDTTRDIAGRILDRALREGVGVDEIAQRLERQLRSFSRPRSIVVARTEVGIASAFGDFQAADQTGVSLRKVWLTANDGGERHPSEPGLEGQIREMDEDFDVRGFPGAHPLALELPASEVVNCRCALGYERA